MDDPALHPLAACHPPGSKVRIVKDSQEAYDAELFDTYTVESIKDPETFYLSDNLGEKFFRPARDCIHPGLDMEWIQRNSPAFAGDSPVRRLLRCFHGKRFLRLRPSIRDRILLREPDLKQRILDLITTLNP